MGILDEFDPRHDGWQFVNWGESTDFSWDLYRRTYLAVNPSNDPVAAPLDVAFYQVFKSCAKNGNCGGMSMLALALFKYGGFMGWCSPPDFYLPANMTDHKQPARVDLHEAINIMQARQFSAAGIRNFLDVVKAGQLSDGVTAWKRVHSGLASGDYCLLSLSNGLFGDSAHTVIPYRAEMSGSSYVLYVWNSNLPYKWFPQHYDDGHNKIVITGPTSWKYDQNLGGVSGGGATIYDGSKNGWCFAIPTSLILHKGHQPMSPGFLLTGVLTLFVSGVGAAITQVEDEKGRRLYTGDRLHRSRVDLEKTGSKLLPGAARWPWPGGVSGETPGELLFLERPPGSGPLTLTVRGKNYHLMALSEGQLTEVVAGEAEASARDRVRLSTGNASGHEVEVSTGAPSRLFDIHHLRHEIGAEWRSVRLRDVRITADHLRLQTPVSFGEVEISGTTARCNFDVEFSRFDGEGLARQTIASQTVPAGRSLQLAPEDWTKLARVKLESKVSEE